MTALRKFATFTGRARRAEYWYYALFIVLISIALAVLENALGMANPLTGRGPISQIFGLATLVPSIAVGVRRMHDVGKSGWFILIPFYNLYLACTAGTPGPNEYGPDPKASLTDGATPDFGAGIGNTPNFGAPNPNSGSSSGMSSTPNFGAPNAGATGTGTSGTPDFGAPNAGPGAGGTNPGSQY